MKGGRDRRGVDLAGALRTLAAVHPGGPLEPALRDQLRGLIGLAEVLPTVPADVSIATPGTQAPARAAPARRSAEADQTLAAPSPAGTAGAMLTRDGSSGGARDAGPGEATVPSTLVARVPGVLQTPARVQAAARGADGGSVALAGATPAPLEGLFPPTRVRAILRETAVTTIDDGPIDLDRALRRIADGDALHAVPRRPRAVLSPSIVMLFDTGPGMLPYTRDKQQLAAAALRLFGSDRVRVADFSGEPLQGVRPRASLRWEPLRWPARGSTLVVVSDLGGGDWQPFLEAARRAGLRCVLLDPYPPPRWPAAAVAFDLALCWDAHTGVQTLRRLMRRGRAG